MLLVAAWPNVGVSTEVEHEQARRLVEQGEILPLQAVAEKALVARPGRLLEAELEREEGTLVYEVEILDERGQVWELEYNAASGELMEEEIED